MKTLEYQLQEFLGIDPKPLSDKVKKFYRLSIDDCLNFTEKAINDKLKEYHKEQLTANEGKICTPSMEEILDEAQRRKAKHSVQYADYSLDTWTVPSDLLEHRKINLLNDSSVRKVRIEYEM